MKNKIFISYKINNFATYLQLIFPIQTLLGTWSLDSLWYKPQRKPEGNTKTRLLTRTVHMDIEISRISSCELVKLWKKKWQKATVKISFTVCLEIYSRMCGQAD